MLCGILGGFSVFGSVGKDFCRLERAVRALLSRLRFIFVLRASAMFWAADMTTSAAVTVGFEIYLCLNNTIPDILVAFVIFHPQAPSTIMLVRGAKHPPFDGVLIPVFPLDGIFVNECLHSDGHKREGKIVVVAV